MPTPQDILAKDNNLWNLLMLPYLGKKGFYRCDQTKDLKITRLFWIIQVVLNAITNVLIREREADWTHTQRRRHWEDRDGCGHKPRNGSSHHKLQEARNGFTLGLQRMRGPADTLISAQ